MIFGGITLDNHLPQSNTNECQFKEWPFLEARRIVDALAKHKKDTVVFETGYGPSGLPHIGTFGEVARTSYVRSALKMLAPSLQSKLITFSDDMDGLRSIPENVPNHQLLLQHLGKPLNSVPDPYDQFNSFSENMNNRLQEFLNSFGFEYEFRSSTDMYKGGLFNEGLSLIMEHHDRVIKIFTATISEEKGAAWSPFFPICEQCGKIYTTRVTQHHAGTNEVSYECAHSPNPAIIPCNYVGRTSIFDGRVKVGWKIDWALRWFSLGIDYEMYGKDLIDSYKVSEKVVRIMGGQPPISYKYELFLDDEGRKISKKIGNGMSLEEWLRYAPSDVLLYFMYSKPSQAKRMGLPLIPKYIDECMGLQSRYKDECDSPIWFINNKQIREGTLHTPSSTIDYSLILNLIRALNVSDSRIIMDYLIQYDPNISQYKEVYEQLVRYAITYNDEYMKHRKVEVTINHDLDKYLVHFKSRLLDLKNLNDITPEGVQTLAFDIAKENQLPAKEWFRYLYQVFLAQDSGPRIGSFICLYGIVPTIEKIERYLEMAA
jgi:lysyl-tRNA synthetase class 1